MRPSLEDLNKLKDVPLEQWQRHKVYLTAASAGSDGLVRSGILQDRRYFTLKHFDNFSRSEFVWGDQFFTK